MKYQAKKGSHLGNKQAQTVGDRHHWLVQKSKEGAVPPQAFLNDARSLDSPTHDLFEWDNKKAAEQQRLQHARYLLASIEVVVTVLPGSDKGTKVVEITSVRGTIAMKDEGYVEMDLRKASVRNEFTRQAIETLREWRNTYEVLKRQQQLKPIFQVIDRLLARRKRK